MARIRTVKPEFWTDGDVMDLSQTARLLFLGSWNFAMCDYGHLADDARRLKMQVLPDDQVMLTRVDGTWQVAPINPEALVEEIIAAGRYARLELDGRTYLHIRRFTDHQRLETRWTPRCPACKAIAATSPETEEPRGTSREPARARRNSQNLGPGQDRTGRDGTGRDVTTAAAAAEGNAAAAPVDNHLGGSLDLPPAVEILKAGLEAHKLTVRWDRLDADQIAQIEALVDTHGDGPLIRAAIATHRPNAPAAFAQAWLATWASLPAPGAGLRVVPQARCGEPGHTGTASTCVECASERNAVSDEEATRRMKRNRTR